MSICPRIEISDLPKDTSRALTPFQKELVKTLNYARQYPEKLAVLKETMKTVYNHINEYQKQLIKEQDNG